MQRAALLIELGRPQEALSGMAEWLAGNPGSARVLAQAAVAHQLLGQPQEALRAARSAAVSAPGDLYVSLVLADALLVAGHVREADALARELVRAHPDEPGAHRIGARTAMRMGPGGQRRALRHARRVVELEPSDPFSHALLARVLTWQGRIVSSRRAARTARSLAPVNTSVRRAVGLADLEGFTPGAAAEGFTAVLVDRPDDRAAAMLLLASLIRAAQLTGLLVFLCLILGGGVALVIAAGQADYDPDAPADLSAAAPPGLRTVAGLAAVGAVPLWWRSMRRHRTLLGRWARAVTRSVGAASVYLLLFGTITVAVALAVGGPAGLYIVAVMAALVTMVAGAVLRSTLRRAELRRTRS